LLYPSKLPFAVTLAAPSIVPFAVTLAAPSVDPSRSDVVFAYAAVVCSCAAIVAILVF
jgi:hypothetical protein